MEAERPVGARPDLDALIVRPRRSGTPGPAPSARTHELLTVRGLSGDVVVPAGSGRRAARSLRGSPRVERTQVRMVRRAYATAFTVGLTRVVARPRSIRIPAGHDSLLEHLATVLDEPGLGIAGRTRRPEDVPALRLVTPTGRGAGFASIGWDDRTRAMVATEAEALRRAAAAGLKRVQVPEVVWHGRWHDLAVLVTAPGPADARRVADHERVGARALLEIAHIDGAVVRMPLHRSPYWQAAADTAAEAAIAGCDDLADRFEALDRRHGDVTLPFGRWHGAFVPWNLTRHGPTLRARGWAHSSAGAPVGFDALHFSFLPTVVLDGTGPDEASALAAVNVAPVLARLGLDADQRDTVVALHRFEMDLRAERARRRTRAVVPARPSR